MEDRSRGTYAEAPFQWRLALRLLSVTPDVPFSRRRLEFLASRREPLWRDDRYVLNALHALLAERVVARHGKRGGVQTYLITSAGKSLREKLRLDEALETGRG